MIDIVDLLKQAKGDVAKEAMELNIEELRTVFSEVDSQMKNLPATAQVFAGTNVGLLTSVWFRAFLLIDFLFAQVANQQGAYLARCFNRMEACERNPEGPIRFRGEGRHRFRPFR